MLPFFVWLQEKVNHVPNVRMKDGPDISPCENILRNDERSEQINKQFAQSSCSGKAMYKPADFLYMWEKHTVG